MWKMSNGGRLSAPIEPKWCDSPSLPACRGREVYVEREIDGVDVELVLSATIDDGRCYEDALVIGATVGGKTVRHLLSGTVLALTADECERIAEDYALELSEDRADARAGL